MPTPCILDASVLIAVARGDTDIMALVQGFDASKQPLVIPAMAIAGASLDTRDEDADSLLAGLELLDAVTVAPLSGAQRATRLAAIMSITSLDPWDAHVAAIAEAAICPILTLNATKWQQPSAALDQPLSIAEIADPDDG